VRGQVFLSQFLVKINLSPGFEKNVHLPKPTDVTLEAIPLLCNPILFFDLSVFPEN
jgi:hypothetical protein